MIAVPDSAKTHTQELLQVPAAGLDSSPRQNIESGVPGILLNLMTMRHEVSDAALAEKTLQSGSASSQVIVLLAKGDLRACSSTWGSPTWKAETCSPGPTASARPLTCAPPKGRTRT